MIAASIGILSGLIVILGISIFKRVDKQTIYGLILSGIGFLYVGFTWTDVESLIICAIQAICFVLFSYFGIKKNLNILTAGYFLHGIWDLVYNLFSQSDLIPPHYDLFCLAIDFTIGIYLLMTKYWLLKKGHVLD